MTFSPDSFTENKPAREVSSGSQSEQLREDYQMNYIVNTSLKTISRAKSAITPALVVALCAGVAAPAIAQDSGEESGAFGLLQAFAQQSADAAEEIGSVDDSVAGEPANAEELADTDISDMTGEVEVSEYDLVDLHVNNEDLGNILQLLSIQSQRNIISSNTVQATITADLYGVTFYEALDSILNVNGFGYIEKGNFIYVYTREELEEFERASRRPISRILHLDYLNSADAAEFAKELLSESGSISTHAATEAFSISDGAPAGADTYASSASIVIHDFEEEVEEIMSLLQELDTKPAQILVESTILQTSLNEANAFGVDFALIKNLNFTDFVGTGGPLSTIDGLISGAGQLVDGTDVNARNGTSSDSGGVTSSVGNTSGPAGLKAGLVNGDVAVFMRVLDEVTDVTIVSNPKILTLNRQPARVLVGTRVGYLNTTSTETATTQTVEFLEVGTELAVRPFVSKNGLIRLELRPQVSSFSLRTITDNTGASVTIPDEDTTEMTTNVMVRDGQTVVLGGLFTETTTATRRQVPVLGNIPLIGQAFRGNDDETRRSEIIFLITPSIVNDTVLTETGEMGSDFVEHARYGARKGLLPWSRERRVGQILIDARRLADEGQVEKALSKIDQALRLQPSSPDARAMRTELTGEMRVAPTRAMIQSILHRELLEDRSGVVQSEEDFEPVTEVNPLSGFDWSETSGDEVESGESESEQVAEVFEPVSDASDESGFESGFESGWESESGFDQGFGSEEVAEGSADFAPEVPAELLTYREITGEDVSWDGFESGSETGSEAVSESGSGSEFVSESQEVAEFTAPETAEFDTNSFDPADFIEEVAGVEKVLPADFDESQWAEYGFEEVAPGIAIEQDFSSICGQLIISLPGGGALQLDWPLSASDWTNASTVDFSEENESAFTEVDSSDFE
ncbi:MAG: type II secretion system protein GspD [Phycisphaerales bacterium]